MYRYPHSEPQLLNWQSSYQTRDCDEAACLRLPRQGEPDHNNSRYEYQEHQQQQDRQQQQQQLSCYSHESIQRKDSPVWGHHISQNMWQREEQGSSSLNDRIVFVKKEPLEESRADSVQQRQEARSGQSVYYSLRNATVYHGHGGGQAQQDSGESNRSLAPDSAGCLYPLDNRARSAGEAGRDGVSLPTHSVDDEGNRYAGQRGDYQAEFRINLYREEERGGMRGEAHRNESGGPTQRRGQFYHHAGNTTEGNGHKDGSHVPQGGGYIQGQRAYDWEGSKSVERSSQPRSNLGDGEQREDPGNRYDPQFGQGQRPVVDPNSGVAMLSKAEREEYYQYDLQISSAAISQGGSGQYEGDGGGSQFQEGEGGQPGRGKGDQPHGGEGGQPGRGNGGQLQGGVGGQFWGGEGIHHHGGGKGQPLGKAGGQSRNDGGQSGWWEGGQPQGREGGPLGGGGGQSQKTEGYRFQGKGGRQRQPERAAAELLANRETGSSHATFGTEQQTIETNEGGADFGGGHDVAPLTNRAGAEESGGRQTACNSGTTGQSGGRPACNPSSTPYVPCPVTPGEELSG